MTKKVYKLYYKFIVTQSTVLQTNGLLDILFNTFTYKINRIN